MARAVRDAAIGTRQSRLKLKPRRRYWRAIHEGLAIGYRRGKQGSGTWSVRLRLASGGYALRALGSADDHADANGVDVLDFAQAQRKALELADQVKRDAGVLTRSVTVADAVTHYLKWFREERRSIDETEAQIEAHILPALGARQVSSLTAREIREWHEGLAAQPARTRAKKIATKPRFREAPKDDDAKRARRSTANRVFTILRAILNRAFRDGLAADDTEWRRVKPFPKVDEPRIRFLTDAEALRLVNACKPDLRALVRGALLSGCRFGELAAMCVRDVGLDGGRV